MDAYGADGGTSGVASHGVADSAPADWTALPIESVSSLIGCNAMGCLSTRLMLLGTSRLTPKLSSLGVAEKYIYIEIYVVLYTNIDTALRPPLTKIA